MNVDLPSEAALRATFDGVCPGTLGIEEEVMVLDSHTLELSPRAPEVLERLGGDSRYKLELPASQLEIVLGPFHRADDLTAALARARADLVRRAGDGVRVAAAGVHPFSPAAGALNAGKHYDDILGQYGQLARRQLVCALQVHVAVGGAERTLAVYNCLRSYLPLLAALAANAPFYEGRDCGLASVRPKLCELLPRQGVPPALRSWAHYARMLEWGQRAGAFPGARTWWWELRPHPRFGTLELRVPDAQSGIADAVGVATVAHALVLWLGDRHDAGERLPGAETWQIEENRWSACRHGTEGTMADLDTGRPRPTAERLHELIDTLAAHGGGQEGLAHARRLVAVNGAMALRAAGAGGPRAAVRWLVNRFAAMPEAG